MSIINTTLIDPVTATPTGLTWESLIIPAGKKVLLRTFGATVLNGTVLLRFGADPVRVVVDGTIEFTNRLEFIGDGAKSLSIQRINNSGTPRIIGAWLDALVED